MKAEFPGASFMEARNYTKGRGSNGTVTRIVIHDEEYPERPDAAERVAQMFATTTRQASCHWIVDSNSIVQCVPNDCRAWHAPPNGGSIGIEHSGYAHQTRAEWLDPYGRQMLELSARLSAHLAKKYKIPIVRLTPQQLRDGKHGFCGHVDVSAAWGQTDHHDPGKNFPWDIYLGLVRKYYEGGVMATLDKDDIENIANATFAKIFNYVIPGQSLNVQTILKRTLDSVSRVEATIDPEKLAKELALKVSQSITPGTAVSVDTLAKALADTLSKRLEA